MRGIAGDSRDGWLGKLPNRFPRPGAVRYPAIPRIPRTRPHSWGSILQPIYEEETVPTKIEYLKRLKADEKATEAKRRRSAKEAHDRALLAQATKLATADAQARAAQRRRDGMARFAAEHRLGAMIGLPGIVTVSVELGQGDHVERQFAERAFVVTAHELTQFHAAMVHQAGMVAATGATPTLDAVIGDVDRLIATITDRTRAAKKFVTIDRAAR